MNGNIWSIDNFTSLLIQIGFNPLLPLSKEQIKLIDSPPVQILQETETLADAEIKLNYIIVNLYGSFKINTNLSHLYNVYKELVSFLNYKKPLSLVSFLNQLVIFDLVFRNFNPDFLCLDMNAVFEERTVVFLLEDLTELPSLSLMKEQLAEASKTDSLHKYLFLFFICTMCNKMDIGAYTFDAFKNNLSLYNQFYISNFSLSIMIHMQMLIYVRLFDKEINAIAKTNKRGSISVGTNAIKRSAKRTLSTAKDNKTHRETADIIPNTFYTFFQDEIGAVPSIQFYTCQNILKLHLNANVTPQLPYKFHIDLIVVDPNYFIGKRLSCEFFGPVSQLQMKGSSKSPLQIMKRPFSSIFKAFTIRNIVISLEKINSIQLVKDILVPYEPLIAKSDSFTFQEEINSQIEQTKQSIDILFLQWSILQLFLYQAILMKKKKPMLSFSFILSSFRLSLSKNILNKEAQLFFKYSHIPEKALLSYLSIHSNLVYFINNILSIIYTFEEYKGYMIGIRISQTNFQSNQLTFFFTIITKAVANYIDYKGLRNMVIYEKSFANYPSTLQVYIKDPNEKKANDRAAKLRLLVKKMEHSKFAFLNHFADALVEVYDIVVMSKEKSNLFKLIRSYDSNMIFFLLTTMKRKENEVATANVDQSNEIIEIISLFSNNKETYDNGLKMFIKMREVINIQSQFRITLIMDKYYLDNIVLADPKFKRYAKALYENVEDFYLIGKKNTTNHANGNPQLIVDSNEALNYDLLISDDCISVVNYKRYNAENDVNYTYFITEFISLLSDCIEFALYVLKNKDIFTPRFIYSFRLTTDDYFYSFNHKKDKIFIKRLEAFDSLITLSLKKAKPLFCLLSKKHTSSYTEANSNFFDVFLRLFLNLHKVLDKNESLNQVFFQKLHKNIFDSYYNAFTPIAFEYKAFKIFNEFFLSNDYLSLSNRQKFENCYLIPFDPLPKNDATLLKTECSMCENVLVYDFHIPCNYWNNNKDICYFTFHKLEKIIEGISKLKKKKNNFSCDKGMLTKYLMRKVASKASASLIMDMYCDKSELNIHVFEDLLLHFHSTRKRIIKQKEDLKTIHTKGMRSEDNRNEDGVVIDVNKLENCIIC